MEEQGRQIDVVQESIEKVQSSVYVLSGIQVVVILFFSEIMCLIRGACHTSQDIDIAPYASHAFLPVIGFCLLLTVLAYQAAQYVMHECLRPLRLGLVFWGVILIVLSVAELISGMILAEERDSAWNSLTPLGKEYYDNDQDNLNESYRLNMGLVCLFQAVSGVVCIATGIAVWILHNKAGQGYLPRIKKRIERDLEEQPLEELEQALEGPLEEPLERALEEPIEARAIPERPFEENNLPQFSTPVEQSETHPLAPRQGNIEMRQFG